MKYKIGDRVRVRGNLEVGNRYGNVTFISSMEKNKTFKILFVRESENYDLNDEYNLCYSPEMLRPAEFKIWCETEKEKNAVLKELEKEGYVWYGNEEKPTNKKDDEFCFYSQMALYVTNSHIKWDDDKSYFESEHCIELTPSEFTGLDFSEKIIITKTPTGATATYGDKTVTTEGDFEDASRQALAEVLCPFKVGDKVKTKKCDKVFEITDILFNGDVRVKRKGIEDLRFKARDLIPYTEPLYNAKLFCIKDGYMGCFKQGHIYEVKDGKFTDFNVDMVRFKNLEEINSKSIAQFMEVKGGLDE